MVIMKMVVVVVVVVVIMVMMMVMMVTFVHTMALASSLMVGMARMLYRAPFT